MASLESPPPPTDIPPVREQYLSDAQAEARRMDAARTIKKIKEEEGREAAASALRTLKESDSALFGEDKEASLRLQEQREISDAALESLLDRAQQIGEGTEGQVFLVMPENLPEAERAALEAGGIFLSDDPMAAKLLKVFSPGKGRQEAQMQGVAREILKDRTDVVRIPKVDFSHTVEFKKGTVAGTKRELIMMEFVRGRTLHSVLKQQLVSLLAKEGLKARPEVDDEYSEYLYDELAKRGFRISPDIASRIRRSVKLLNQNNMFHHDLHAGNIMISGSVAPAERSTTWMIDFGRANDLPKAPGGTSVGEDRLASRLEMLLSDEDKNELAGIEQLELFEGEAQKSRDYAYAGLVKTWRFNISEGMSGMLALKPQRLARVLYLLVQDGLLGRQEALAICRSRKDGSREMAMAEAILEKKAEA